MATYRSPAVRRYMGRIIVLVVIYLATLFLAVRAFRADAVSGVLGLRTCDTPGAAGHRRVLGGDAAA